MLSLSRSRSSRFSVEVAVVASSRCLATLLGSEEFPLTLSVAPKAKKLPVIKESTLANGIKVVSSETGSSVGHQIHEKNTSPQS